MYLPFSAEFCMIKWDGVCWEEA